MSETENVIEKKKSKTGLIIGLVAIIAVIAIITIIVVIAGAPSKKAHQALALGERYLNEMDYESAIAQFAKAIEIDPNNSEIKSAVDDYISQLIDEGYDLIKDGKYDDAIDIANAILDSFPDNKKAKDLLEDAEDAEDADNAEKQDNILDGPSSNNPNGGDNTTPVTPAASGTPVGESPVIYYNYYVYMGGFILEDFADVTYEEFERNYDPISYFFWAEDKEDGYIGDHMTYTCTELPCNHPDEQLADWITYTDYEVTFTVTDSDNNTTSATVLLHYENSPGHITSGSAAPSYHSIRLDSVIDGDAKLYE